ncbi:MAG: CDP-diacylglycerol--glycerol-3-phosphate 3-phosphatidyltransferase [Deltaproteobacteria bacterium]|nr:CDP-diacylglycerol--glycerol-3-phosphate 3-phosphatidyltransferase [Deltaproteobacteria bacterium]MBW1936417.1 CDP-diacylglycerol--glycerol-3-phosphate 3-phosphatidyltransferase [Deltaproteobacteria bacterium]MBW2009751.1 CDP-diacylglycerol--glycerol-3-phosphate 3-phosphatidyltransferase [Deltaproteobacteria bacterium]
MTRKDFNIPNLLSAFRAILLPFFIYMILQPSQSSRMIAFAVFAFASFTDLFDGYLARRLDQETELGKFLDPLADKCLVLGAFITFIFLSEQIQVWMVLCILARDIVITCFRYLAIYQGKTLQTSRLAKVKTAFQMFSIMVILTSFMVLTVREYDLINQQYHSALESGLSRWDVAGANIRRFLRGQYDDFFFGLTCFLPYYLMILTTIITILSLLRYLFTNYKLLHGPIPVIRPKEKEKGYWQDLDKGRISALNKFRRSAGERKSG